MTTITTDALQSLFRPSSVALVGATDNSGWSVNTFQNLRTRSFSGPVHLVNPRTEFVHGERSHRSLSEIGEPIDLAYVMTPTDVVLQILRDGAACGIRSYIVLTPGFGEVGAEGRRRQEELVEFATGSGLTILGPNGIGYINAAAGVMPYSLPVPAALASGSIGLVSQSGALAHSLLWFANAANIGFSFVATVGNEAMVTVNDVMSYLVDDPTTKVIALFLESVRRPAGFIDVCELAARAGKQVVALKIGKTQSASRVAQAHTGALVGEDRVVDAALRRLGVVRVDCLEDLIFTSAMLSTIGRIGRRVGIVTVSGGASEILADRAEEAGFELPSLAPETCDRLKEIMPDFGTPQNPLDITGYAMLDETIFTRALGIVTADPHVDVGIFVDELPRDLDLDPGGVSRMVAAAAEIRRADVPVIVLSDMMSDVAALGSQVQAETGIPYFSAGIEHGLAALGNVLWWSHQRSRASSVEVMTGAVPLRHRAGAPGAPAEVWAEHQAAQLLSEHGIPVVPSELVMSEDAAVAAANRLGYPVVLKAAAQGLGHKSDIGGVRLGITSQEAVRNAHREITDTLRARGVSEPATLVQPQRDGGIELLVGIVRDAAWGLTLTVGLGGIWVEVLADTALRILPATEGDIASALHELRGSSLLFGARGAEPVDLAKLVVLIARICDLALDLGPRLSALEVNPLLVRGAELEALDALIVWN